MGSTFPRHSPNDLRSRTFLKIPKDDRQHRFVQVSFDPKHSNEYPRSIKFLQSIENQTIHIGRGNA